MFWKVIDQTVYWIVMEITSLGKELEWYDGNLKVPTLSFIHLFRDGFNLANLIDTNQLMIPNKIPNDFELLLWIMPLVTSLYNNLAALEAGADLR